MNPTQVRPAERKPKPHTPDQITALLGRGRAKGAAKIRVRNDLGLEYCKKLKRWVPVDRDETDGRSKDVR